MALLKLNKLPRFYVACSQKCDKLINPSGLGSLINREVCQRTERTAEYCHIGQFLLFGIKVIIYTINLINSKPKKELENYSTTVGNIVPNVKSRQNINISKFVNNSNHSVTSGKYIYIQVDKPKRRKKLNLNRRVTGNRKSPVPHTRRRHNRHLKSGKVIWIPMSYIGLKEKEKANKKIYKIK
jgi:hypothetical protein